MASDLTFTGERFVPACAGEIAYEHWHRYAFARRYVEHRRVLDAACGEGYGTALLGAKAAEAVGVDIDTGSIQHAQSAYGSATIRFVEGSCTALPFADASFDIVVSFETIEHLDAADQPPMLAEFARVLKPAGLLIISSPNKRLYSDARDYANEFHRHELYRDGLSALLAKAFPAQRWFHQQVASWSSIWSEDEGDEIEAWLGDSGRVSPYAPPEGMYFIVVAARTAVALPAAAMRGSLFTDAEETEQKRAQANASEVLRQDALLKDRDAALDRQTAHIHHLEALVAERERVIADKDSQLAELDAARQQREQLIALRDRELSERDRMLAERDRMQAEHAATIRSQAGALERERQRLAEALKAFDAERTALRQEIAARDQTIAARHTFRWWLSLPWRRLSLWLQGR
ncbi:MAG TPA: methyltransferase domain-containing protein [Casimicrobiaceae bacterium]|jgi:ubiquinone/menaquinone biosynthesis C-methylase UbiE|nr:methyltransferase domain-containing protein [Casimicrobiaceae bacterium]